MKKLIFVFIFSLCLLFGFSSVPVQAYNLTFQDYPDVEFDTSYTVVYENGKYVYTLVADIKGCAENSASSIYWSNDNNLVGGGSDREWLCYLRDGKYQSSGSGSSMHTVYTITYESDTLLYDESGKYGIFLNLAVQLGSVNWSYYFLEFDCSDGKPIPSNSPAANPTDTPTPSPTVMPTPKLSIDFEVDDTSVNAIFNTSGGENGRSIVEFYWATDGLDSSDGTSYELDLFEFGSGKYSYSYDDLKYGEYYYFRLIYEYEIDGEEFTDVLYSDFFLCEKKVLPPVVAPTPKLNINLVLNGTSVTADFYTGGMDSVRSIVEFYWATDGLDSSDGTSYELDLFEFVDGNYSYSYDDLKVGEYYYFRLIYEYELNGEEYTEVLYSDMFLVSSSYNPFSSLGNIMRWIWDSLLEVEITYEGFTVTFKQLFMFVLVAPLAILTLLAIVGVRSFGDDDKEPTETPYLPDKKRKFFRKK